MSTKSGIPAFRGAPPKPATPEDFLGGAAMTAATQPAESEPPAPAAVQEVPPAVASAPAPVPAQKEKGRAAAPAPQEEDESVYRTLTLRLNKARYKRLKMLSTLSEIAIQHLLTEALDEYLPKKEKALRD